MPRWTVALALAFVGCSSNPMPGTLLGTYTVVGQSQTNSCGLAAPNPWQFDVQLSEDGSTLYWSFMDGSPFLSGAVAESQATLSTSQTANVDGSEAGLGPCDMQRNDTYQLSLSSGSPPPSFSGTITYAFSVPSGYSCGDQLDVGRRKLHDDPLHDDVYGHRYGSVRIRVQPVPPG